MQTTITVLLEAITVNQAQAIHHMILHALIVFKYSMYNIRY